MKVGEVADLLDLPKQRIHEYEQAGIAFKHDPAHAFEYSEADIERLWMIKFYKELGYTVPQMKKIFLDPQYNASLELAIQIEKLKAKKKEYEEMIERAELYQRTGLTSGSLFSAFPAIREHPYLTAQSILQNLAKLVNSTEGYIPSEGQTDVIESAIAEIKIAPPEKIAQIIEYDSEARKINLNLDTVLGELGDENEFIQFRKLFCSDTDFQNWIISTFRDYAYFSILSKAKHAIERDKRFSKKKMDESSFQEMAESVANDLVESLYGDLFSMLGVALDELSQKVATE